MAQDLKLKIKGLYLHPNPLSEAPDGALAIADNIVVDRESVAESRRGFKQYGDQLSVGTDRINKYFNYQDKLLVHYDDKLAYDSDDAGTWVQYSGTYDIPDTGYQLRSIEANRAFYFTTSTGVKKIDSITGTPALSGMYKALDGEGSTTGSSGFMPDDSTIAYRMIWGIKDANEYLILGAPSQRVIVSNTAGATRDVSLTFSIPSGITTSHFYQIYRSPATAAAADEPSDEMQLVIEDFPTSGEISAGAFTDTDSTPDSLKGAFLYTSPSQEGIAQANEVPPYCKDMTVFRDYVFYANTKQKHRLYLTMISAGFSVNDTVVIAGTTYTAKGTENIANKEFEVFSGGTPAENIEDTSLSLIRVINRNTTNTDVYAYYLSGFADLPGKILIEERGTGGSSFAATAGSAATGGLFSPELPTSGTSVSSTNDEKLHRVHIAKFKQPGAAPLLQFLDCGSADQPIQRILALRDAVFILKEDGIFRIGGDDVTTFRVTQFDNTVQLLAGESAVVFNNQIYCFTDQGIVSVSDTGVQVVSRQIEKTLLELTELSNFAANTWAVGYESDRKYILYTVSRSTDTAPVQAFVFNTATTSWTKWTNTASAGIINSRDNKLYLGHPTDDYTRQERKDFTLDDYADEEYDVTITGAASYTNILWGSFEWGNEQWGGVYAPTNYTVELTDTSSCEVGMTLRQGNMQSVIVEVTDSTHIVVSSFMYWANGAAKVYTPILLRLEFVPITAGNPGLLKHFSEATNFFSDAGFDSIECGFASNFNPTFSYTDLTAVVYRPWGEFEWGDEYIPWGGTVGGFQPIRTFVPREYRKGLWLYLRLRLEQAFRNIKYDGCSIMLEPISPRFK
jgi:hypothetical protein